MSKVTEYRDFLSSVRTSPGYWKSFSLLQFTTSLARIMRLEKVSGKKLASRLSVSAAQVSKVLRGQENVTIETMAKFADALDSAVHIHVAKKGVVVTWKELPAGQAVLTEVAYARSAGSDASPIILASPTPSPADAHYVSASWIQ